MGLYLCQECYKTSKEKAAICPRCGATDSFVPPDQLSTHASPIGPRAPVGKGTGGVMPKIYEELLPPLPILPTKRKKESENRSKRD